MALWISSSIQPDHGFHRTFSTELVAEDDELLRLVERYDCSLHLYYKLPVLVFVDPYELANYRHLYSYQHHGSLNLELPVIAMDSKGSSLLVKLVQVERQMEVQIPIHLRYGEASHSRKYQTAKVSWPDVFLACSLPVPETENENMLTAYRPPSPEFEFSSSLEKYTLHTPLLSFHSNDSNLDSSSTTATRSESVSIPVGQLADVAEVRFGTAFTILGMFFYLGYISYKTVRRLALAGQTQTRNLALAMDAAVHAKTE